MILDTHVLEVRFSNFQPIVETPGMHLSTDCACSCSNRHWSEWRTGWGLPGFFSKVTPQQRKVEIFNHYWILWMTLPGVVGQEPSSFLLGNYPQKYHMTSGILTKMSWNFILLSTFLQSTGMTLAYISFDGLETEKKWWWDIHSQHASEAIFHRCAWGRWRDFFLWGSKQRPSLLNLVSKTDPTWLGGFYFCSPSFWEGFLHFDNFWFGWVETT